MSSLVNRIEDRVKSPEFAIAIGSLVVSLVLILLIWDLSDVITAILAISASVVVTLIYNDVKMRNLSEEDEVQKGKNLLEKRKSQLETEQKEGRCISCNKPIDKEVAVCPHCGYKMHKYHTDEASSA